MTTGKNHKDLLNVIKFLGIRQNGLNGLDYGGHGELSTPVRNLRRRVVRDWRQAFSGLRRVAPTRVRAPL